MVKKGYTAALEFPGKLLQCNDAVVDGKIRPYHIQFSPTNRCNGNCPWCSCRDVDRSLEMPIAECLNMLEYFKKLGTKAITITGGGEPTIHPGIYNIILHAKACGIDVGIVTNGLKWGADSEHVPVEVQAAITWMRVSIIDTEGEYDTERIARIAAKFTTVDIGISFTTTPNVNVKTAIELSKIANRFKNITHIRFVQDVLNTDDSGVTAVKEACESLTDKSIFQYRNKHGWGASKCWLSRLKPFIAPNGIVYPCCGVQYATDITRKLPFQFRMGHWRDFASLHVFDGSRCKRCHYQKYNDILNVLTDQYEHGRFI